MANTHTHKSKFTVLQTNQITKVSFAFEMWCSFARWGESQWERDRGGIHNIG